MKRFCKVLLTAFWALLFVTCIVACSDKDSSSDNKESGGSRYTVTYDSCGGSEVPSVTVKEGAKLTAPSNPVKQGYIFGEWYADKEYKSVWDFSTHAVTKNITLYAKWVAEEGRIVSVENAKIENENIVMFVDEDTVYVPLATSISISGDATWKLYYDRMGQIEIPTRIAAQIDGTLEVGDNIFYIVTTTSDGSQVRTYTLNVHKRRRIQIDCRVEGGDKLLGTITVLSYTPITNDQINAIKYKGYTINGWTDENDKTVTFGDDGTVFADSAHIYAKVAPNRYKISYDAKGGEVKNSSREVTFDSGYTLDVPTKTGCSFLCWATSVYDSQSGDSTEQELTFESGRSYVPYTFDKDITAYAKYEANSYNVNAKSNDNSAGTVSGTGEYKFESGVTVKATTNNGYTFMGWYDGNTELTKELTYTFAMPAENKTYTAKWIPCPITLEKNIEEAGSVSGTEKTISGRATTVTATKNNGYIFIGWYDGNTELTKELTYTFTMSAEKKTYTAKFEKCTSHTLDSECVCTICGATAHTPNAKCECTVCGATDAHTLDDNCVCTVCGKFDEIAVSEALKVKTYIRHDNNIYFGSYPQTEVTDSDLVEKLDKFAGTLPTSSNSANWTSYGYYISGNVSDYMWYIDKEYDGEKYRGVYFTSYRPYLCIYGGSEEFKQDDNGYTISNVYWFKYEPIKWKILSEDNDNGKALILADLAIDSQQYYHSAYNETQTRNGKSVYANNYAESDIRKWLNETFYNTAFTSLQK